MTEQTEQTTRDQTPDIQQDVGAQQGEAGPQAGPGTTDASGTAAAADERAPLFATDDAERYRQRWESLQARFVDQPRETVAEADNLVSELMQQLTASFADRRSSLEAHWEQGDQVSTEELRVTLTRYRSFFNRLLSV